MADRFATVLPPAHLHARLVGVYRTGLAKGELLCAVKDANPSGFVAHNETGNPEATDPSVALMPESLAEIPSGKAQVGHAGETAINPVLAFNQANADRIAAARRAREGRWA